MSSDLAGPEGGEVRVDDDEGIVDRKTKEHVLSLRKQIDEDERLLYVELQASGKIGLQQANEYWGVSVRQYLRGIKRLWNDEDVGGSGVKNVEYYWKNKNIAEYDIPPPDTERFNFSELAYLDQNERAVKRQLGLPMGSTLPRPKPVKFFGLQSILEQRRIHMRWSVKVDDRGPAPEHEYVTLEREFPLPKSVLEQAVEVADNFLQQAGIGFETSVPPYMGGEEPGI